MRRTLIAALIALAAAALPAVASADSGNFTTNDGPSCSWTGFGSMYSISCSGYSFATGGYTSYTCDLFVYGPHSSSWTCRDMRGNTWRGSN